MKRKRGKQNEFWKWYSDLAGWLAFFAIMVGLLITVITVFYGLGWLAWNSSDDKSIFWITLIGLFVYGSYEIYRKKREGEK